MYRLYAVSFASGGLSIGDVNGDGWPDILATGGPVANRLYIQEKPGLFKENPAFSAAATSAVWSAGAAMVDIDGDEDLDLYICHYDSPNSLYINDGNGAFSEEAARFGLDIRDACLMPAFCDYDRDGDLDLYLLTYQYVYDFKNRSSKVAEAIAQGETADWPLYFEQKGKDYNVAGRPDRLLQNDGNGRFIDATQAAGLHHQQRGYGNSVSWWDYDNDGWMDLYVGNDFTGADYLYLNQRDGTFKDVIREATPHTTWFSMGAATGDLNNDGIIDLLISDMAATTHFKSKMSMGDMAWFAEFLDTAEPRQFMRNALFLGTGTKHLREAANLCGLAKTDWTWAVKVADFDADGREDAFFANGISRPFRDSDRGTQLAPDALNKTTEFDLYADLPPPA